ncbi:ATP-binding protein [Foetidibacter luteolus]
MATNSPLGFGLYLCKAIIRAHGGEIVVNSEPGKGSAFIFTLPVSRSGT